MRDAEVVGHIAFSRARLESGPPVAVLGPMAVLPEHQRQGVDSALVSEGLRRAAETEFPVVVLVRHPAHYPRFGFGSAEVLGISAPAAVPSPAWMAYRLPAYRQDARGTVVFHGAFGM